MHLREPLVGRDAGDLVVESDQVGAHLVERLGADLDLLETGDATGELVDPTAQLVGDGHLLRQPIEPRPHLVRLRGTGLQLTDALVEHLDLRRHALLSADLLLEAHDPVGDARAALARDRLRCRDPPSQPLDVLVERCGPMRRRRRQRAGRGVERPDPGLERRLGVLGRVQAGLDVLELGAQRRELRELDDRLLLEQSHGAARIRWAGAGRCWLPYRTRRLRGSMPTGDFAGTERVGDVVTSRAQELAAVRRGPDGR